VSRRWRGRSATDRRVSAARAPHVEGINWAAWTRAASPGSRGLGTPTGQRTARPQVTAPAEYRRARGGFPTPGLCGSLTNEVAPNRGANHASSRHREPDHQLPL
jgi:hypothetical protein